MHSFRDITGQRFGRLIALEPTEKRKNRKLVWKCQCDCGNITYVASDKLILGKTKSCRCLQKELISKRSRKDITGQRFGKLIAIEPTDIRKNRKILWKCICDCGNICYISVSSLKNNKTKSCGCLFKEMLIKRNKRNIKHGLSYTKEYKKAKDRKRNELKKQYDSEYGIELELTLKEFFPTCVICGITREEHIKKYGRDLENDHVLPLSKGHGLIPGNAVVLCRFHNGSKKAKSLDRLPQEWIDKILVAAKEFEEHWNDRN